MEERHQQEGKETDEVRYHHQGYLPLEGFEFVGALIWAVLGGVVSALLGCFSEHLDADIAHADDYETRDIECYDGEGVVVLGVVRGYEVLEQTRAIVTVELQRAPGNHTNIAGVGNY